MINLALIGAGKWGKNYLRAVKNLKNVRIKYVCSGKKSIQTISSEYIKIEDYRKLAQKKDLNGVIIATPPLSHFKLAQFFLSIGKPILLEKPMVVSYKEAKELKNIFEKTKGELMVGNIFLYNQAFQEFKKFFNKMKNIQYFHFEGCDAGPVRSDISALWDWASHDVSMCLELLGKMPLSVSAWAVNTLKPGTNLYDMVYARLLFENNLPVFLKIGWLSPIKKREIIVVGKEESLLFDDVSDKKIVYMDSSSKRYIEYPQSEPLVRELEDFIELIKNGKEPLSDFDKSFTIIKIINAMEESIKNNGAVIKIGK